MNVHVLKTCRNINLLDMTNLVFRTIRTGFPTLDVVEHDNSDNQYTHASWLSELITNNTEPFWVCDTDVVFFNSVENIKPEHAITGRLEPAFHEPWINAYKTQRIHTCLMLIDPTILKDDFDKWLDRFDTELLTKFGFEFCLHDYIKGCLIPTPSVPLLYDTMSRVCSVVSHRFFTEEEDSRFEHLHAGTYSDKVSHMSEELRKIHVEVTKNPLSAKGLKKQQDLYYRKHKIYA